LGLSQKEAAEALGLKRRVLQYYEKGERDGERVSVPKTVRLACYALLNGITDYHGPNNKQENESLGEDVTQEQKEQEPE
jgi:transcriptional regulator with XRE-family HTH domain